MKNAALADFTSCRFFKDVLNVNNVAISEAVALASELSTDDSGTFVNGILAAVAATRKPI